MIEEMCYSSIVQQTETLRPPSPDQLYNWSLHVHKHLTENLNVSFMILHFVLMPNKYFTLLDLLQPQHQTTQDKMEFV